MEEHTETDGRHKNDEKELGFFAGIVDKYRPLWYIGVAVLLALGFDFKLPKTKFSELERSIDDINVRMTSDRTAVNLLDAKLDVLIRLQCRQSKTDVEFAGGQCK